MAMTKEERDTLAALSEKAKAEEEAEKGYELWVKKGDHEVKLTGAKARAFAQEFGIEKSDEPEAEEGEQDPEPEDKGGYFAGRRKK
jgi:hypothetical protein